MDVTFYKTTSPKNALNKTLTDGTTKACTLKMSKDICNPSFIVGYDSSLLSRSYAYISDWGRYYFIESIEVTPGQEMLIKLHVDVLTTYATEIKACKARITRSQSNFDKYIPDSMIINKAQTKITQRKLGTGFTSANKYYIMIGG